MDKSFVMMLNYRQIHCWTQGIRRVSGLCIALHFPETFQSDEPQIDSTHRDCCIAETSYVFPKRYLDFVFV